ncbi:DUF2274 domain-containing protein [Govanella unica]|uniref:DUF2274 domain-containing protein n=1 Tax=Govanella unica TaxID=2975056 RepID=A0A9X3TYH0_9PROT|nr:DUF2274 domain-containing protein [Govania unica]MDA5193717.1 DUF2274 domain-containing protein [Govania unica]
MTTLKLCKLPDRTPVKLSIVLDPKVMVSLSEYADVYLRIYGEEVAPADLIPFMLSSFLDTDKGFQKARRKTAERSSDRGAQNLEA